MNFAFAGFMMAIWYFISPQGMIIKNSIVYFNISPIILIGSTAVCYVVIRFIYRFIGKHEVSGGCCTVTVVWKEKTVECNAKLTRETVWWNFFSLSCDCNGIGTAVRIVF